MRPSDDRTAAKPLTIAISSLAVVATALLASTSPVLAKGPESATIIGSGIDEPIELLKASRDLDPSGELARRLIQRTGLWSAPTSPARPAPTGERGPAYTLIWVNAGPPSRSVDERTIRQELYPDADDGPLIHTPAQESLRGWGPGVIGWFDAPSKLRGTLIQLGVPIPPLEPVGAAVPADADQSEAIAVADADSESSLRRGGAVALAVALCGLGGVLGVRQLRRPRANSPTS